MTRSLHFFAIVGAMLHLVVAERPGHAYVGFVTENILGACQLGFDRRHHQLGGARAKADDGQATTPAAQLVDLDRHRCQRNDQAPLFDQARIRQCFGGHADKSAFFGSKTQCDTQHLGRCLQGRFGHGLFGNQQARQ
ncbi:hypothetical protein D3C79_827110 [compost metagenome]